MRLAIFCCWACPLHSFAPSFDLCSLLVEAENLDDENPCKYVHGVAPTNQEMEGAEGMTAWINDGQGNEGPGQGGVTYKSVKECTDRAISRERAMSPGNDANFWGNKLLTTARRIVDFVGDIAPDALVAPLGFGLSFKPGDVVKHSLNTKINIAQHILDVEQFYRSKRHKKAGLDDCDPIQHGFARAFCDLHCVRDAVRKGDSAILRALEEAVEVVGRNTQVLLEHYVGDSGDSGISLDEEASEIRRGVERHLAKIRAISQAGGLVV